MSRSRWSGGSPETAPEHLGLAERSLTDLEHEMAQRNETVGASAWYFRQGLATRIAETRKVIARLRAQFAADRP